MMKHISRTWFCCILFVACICVTSESWADTVKVICNGQGCDETVSPHEIQRIFLGKQSKWDSGTKVTLATLKSGPAHDAFLSNYVRKTPKKYKVFWKKLAFTGKASEPKSFASEADLVRFVKSHTGAVGYVASGTSSGGCTVITVEN